MNQPTGTVAFLFTDIEGSTKLWQADPAGMQKALAAHDKALREAVDSAGGWIFKTIGDAFCVAFKTVSAAISAALTAQQAITQRPNDPKTQRPIRVRMAIHVGSADERDGDYFGQTLNRVARMLAAAHGGQVLISGAAERLAHDSLPEGAGLFDLGPHRLRDLNEPEHLFQLTHPALPRDFPPIRSLAGFPNNLPLQLTSFIGREREIEQVRKLLGSTRLLTLTGSGGCGKTRLALQVAVEVLEEYPDGVWFVELASLSEPSLIAHTIAVSLKVPEPPNRSIEEDLGAYLAGKSLLLILDNCEQVVDGCARLAERLLKRCENLVILATSRSSLGVGGEVRFDVRPLDVPSAESPAFEAESIRLFLERARCVRPQFEMTPDRFRTVAHICRRLDGIPLAIELAAARVGTLGVQQIADRLDDRFSLLTIGSRTAVRRQRTLRAALDWSYDLLDPIEQTLLCRLSIFSGGWTIEAAETACPDSTDGSKVSLPADQVLDALTQLVDKSLVIVDDAPSGRRYRLLETIREYARGLLDPGELPAVGQRHLEYYLGLAEEALPHYNDPTQLEWLNRVEADHDNMRAALEWCRRDPANAERGLLLAGSLARFWHIRGYFTEGRRRLAEAMGLARDKTVTRPWAVAYNGAGILAWAQGDLKSAESHFTAALDAFRQLGDQNRVAAALNNVALVMVDQGKYESAESVLKHSLAIRRQLSDPAGIAISLDNLGNLAYFQRDYEGARRFYEESHSVLEQLGDSGGRALSLNNLGQALLMLGNLEAAGTSLRESLELFRALDDRHNGLTVLYNLADLALLTNDPAEAKRLCAEVQVLNREAAVTWSAPALACRLAETDLMEGSTERARDLFTSVVSSHGDFGVHCVTARAVEGLAVIRCAQDDLEMATALLGAASRIREAAPSECDPVALPCRENTIETCRSKLGKRAFAKHFKAGYAMDIEEVGRTVRASESSASAVAKVHPLS